MSCCNSSTDEPIIKISPPKITRKVSLLGNSNVGKSSLLNKYITGDYSKVQATVGAAFNQKRMCHTFIHPETKIEEERETQCQFWDTAGQEKYHSLAPFYLRGSDICLVCFSLVDKQSFEKLSYWIKVVSDNCPNATIIIVGCKTDLPRPVHDLIIEKDFVEATYPRYIYMETSSRTGHGVDELFDYIAIELLR